MENQPTRRLPWTIVVLVVAALCVVSYFLAQQVVKSRANRLNEVINVPARSDQLIKPLGDGLIYYDGATLHAMDSRGRQIWSYAAGAMADFSVGDGGVATWSQTTVSLLSADNGTVLYSGHVEKPVLKSYMGTMYAAVQIGEEHDSTMLITDHKGRQVDKISMPNQIILDFGFYNNGASFWVMNLDTEGTAISCEVTIYRPNKALAGKVPDTSQLLYKVFFLSSKIRVVGTDYIKDFDYIGNEIADNRILVYGWYMLDADEEQQDPLMVFVPDDQADGTVGITDIRCIQDQTDTAIRLPSEAKQVFALGDTVYAFGNDRVMVCRLGEPEPDIKWLPLYVDKVLSLTTNHSAIVTSGSDVFMIPLP